MAQSAASIADAQTFAPTEAADRRILALDGLRGLMTIFVLVSHFFGEVAHGVKGVMVGWIAVDMFFVLSGFLIGRLIIERRRHQNFFAVFYVRRFCRLIPLYSLVVVVTALLMWWIDRAWMDADVRFPVWSYLSFTQTFFMVADGHIGAHWLAPTWTLAVEEHFYLVAPALLVFAPRRWLPHLLVALALLAVALRLAVFGFGFGSPMIAMVMLPFRADLLLCGILAALAYTTPGIRWERWLPALRTAPLASLLAVIGLQQVSDAAFQIWNPFVLGIGCSCLILAIVLDAPEAARFKSRALRFCGDTSYAVYLVHLPLLGLAHGLLLGSKPDLATPAQWLVSLGMLPVVILVGWLLTRFVEEPFMRYGRTWRWSSERRPQPA